LTRGIASLRTRFATIMRSVSVAQQAALTAGCQCDFQVCLRRALLGVSSNPVDHEPITSPLQVTELEPNMSVPAQLH